MRKLFCLLLILALAILPPAALAVDAKLDSIGLLLQYFTDTTTSRVIGAAAYVADGSETRWLTASAWLGAEHSVFYVMMENGDLSAVSGYEPLGESGLAELTLKDTIRATPAPLSAVPGDLESQAFLGYLENAALVSTGAEHLIPCTLDDGSDGMIFTGTVPGLLPGSATYGEDGALTGIVIASLGEGESRYLAVSASAVRGLLSGASDTPGEKTSALTDLTFERDNGYLYVRWDQLGLSEDTPITLYFMDPDNTFYSWATRDPELEKERILLPAVPGRSLMIWYAVGDEEQGAAVFDRLTQTQEPASFDFDPAGEMGYGYRQECYIALTPAGRDPGATVRLSPALNLTPELLLSEDSDVWLQVNSSYTVDKNIEDSLLICLYTPDGNCLTDVSGFIYGTSFMAEDDWHAQADGLFADYADLNGGTLPAGKYTLSYYVGTAFGGSFTFTLGDDPGAGDPV